MRAAQFAFLMLVAVALVGVAVALTAAQSGQKGTTGAQESLQTTQERNSPWLANGSGGKVVKGREDTDDPAFAANTTITMDNHAPGGESTLAILSTGFTEQNRVHYNILYQPAFDWSSCSAASDPRAFGIDRGNDDPGTQTDKSLLDSYRAATFTDEGVFLEFYKEETVAGSPFNVTVEDQIAAKLAACQVNPDEEGWYRMSVRSNGSTKLDNTTDYAIYGAARWVYICEGCDSRQDAIDQLGPVPTTCPEPDTLPPGSLGGNDKEWTCRSPNGTYYTTDDGGGGGADTGGNTTPTATPTPASGDGDTPTPTATPTATRAASDDGNDGGSDDGSTPTATRAADDGGSDGGNGDGSTPTATRAASGDDGGSTPTATQASGGGGGGGASGGTPTIGSGPGFGALAALVALLGGALLALRRR